MSYTRYFITASVDKFATFQINVVGGIPICADELELYVDLKDGEPKSIKIAEVVRSIKLLPNPAPAYAEHAKYAVAHWDNMLDEVLIRGPEYRASAALDIGVEISLCIESEYKRHNPDLYIEYS